MKINAKIGATAPSIGTCAVRNSLAFQWRNIICDSADGLKRVRRVKAGGTKIVLDGLEQGMIGFAGEYE